MESAALTVPEVAEAAAVPVMDEIRGRVVEMYVSLKPGTRPARRPPRYQGDRDGDREDRPAQERVGGADMPKTRSGKIMRRVIAAVSNFTESATSHAGQPRSVDGIRHHVQAAKVASGDTPRELSETEKTEIQAFGAES